MMAGGGLRAIAQRMRSDALLYGDAARRLRGGLYLELTRISGRDGDGGGWKLRLARQDKKPSAVEVNVCRQHFNVPRAAEVEWGAQEVTLQWQ